MTTYASASDVAARLGRELTTEETTLVGIRLADAERMIRRSIPDLAAKVGDETIDVEDVKQVEADAVLRLVRNPEGLLSEGDGNYQYQVLRDIASGKLEIPPADWETLGVNTVGMFCIAPRPVGG